MGLDAGDDSRAQDGDVKIPCEVYSRIVGYLRPVQDWNPAKRAEFEERVTYQADNEPDTGSD